MKALSVYSAKNRGIVRWEEVESGDESISEWRMLERSSTRMDASIHPV